MKKLSLILIALSASAGCNGVFGGAADYFTGPVSGVGLKASTSIASGSTERLSVIVVPSKTANKRVSWSSSDESVATVDQTGLVSAVAVVAHGETRSATITVLTDEGSFSAECVVTVVEKPVPVTALSLNNNVGYLVVDDPGVDQLLATISPSDATNQTITWTSDASAIVSVDSTGLVTAKQAGKGTITATSSNGITAKCSYTVLAAPVLVTAMRLNKTSSVIAVGKTETFYPVITPTTATNQNVTWASSNESIATVSAIGTVTGIAASATPVTITATTTDGTNLSSSTTVTVAATVVPVTGVSLSLAAATITIGRQQQMIASITPSTATDQNLIWTSSNTSAAVVDSSGLVTALSSGSATITVTTGDGAFTATCLVNATSQPTYTVTYDGNGATGTGPSDSASYLSGATVTVMTNTGFVNGTKSFSGWQDGSGTAYSAGSTFKMGSADVTLYAQWSDAVAEYSVTYTDVSGDSSVSGIPAGSSSYASGEAVIVATAPTRTGYVFAGWNFGTKTYQSGDVFLMGAAAVTLTAVWNNTLTYVANYPPYSTTGGSVPSAQTFVSVGSVTVSGNVNNLTASGYVFDGWNTNANGTGNWYTAGSTYSVSGTTSLYAHWLSAKQVFSTPTAASSHTSITVHHDTTIIVKAWGGGGAGPLNTIGGEGGYVFSTSNVSSGQTLFFCVGTGGTIDGDAIAGLPASAGSGSGGYRGGGGSVVAVYNGSSFTLIACAGGGGGASIRAEDVITQCSGGSPAATVLPRGDAKNGGAGVGGAGSSGNPGSDWNFSANTFANLGGQGGNTFNYGSGGGGFGGGGGGSNSGYYASGGGGSFSLNGYCTVGLQASTDDADYVSGVGASGVVYDAIDSVGGDGLVIIYFMN